jgi:predicted RNA binding protein YcfA (HicA-like mRNA interferase family)
MAAPETSTRKIVRRLEREGWVNEGGGKHDVFKHPDGRKIAVPRHRTQSPRVARSIAKTAGWT